MIVYNLNKSKAYQNLHDTIGLDESGLMCIYLLCCEEKINFSL